MTNEEILNQYLNPDTKRIYGYMYGAPYIYCGNDNYRKDKIIEIDKHELILGIRKDCFVYVWGWPGPDANIYKFFDYGVTWAFSEKEIQEVSYQEWDDWRTKHDSMG